MPKRAVVYGMFLAALILAAIYYWFAVADRAIIFLYDHDMGPLVPDTAPFSRVTVSRYWTDLCGDCALKGQCTTGKERRISRWEHEHLVEDMQRRLDENPGAMRQRRETVEHPFGTIKMRMGATHFLMKRLKNVRTEMALSVLAYNLTRVMNIIGIRPLMAAIRA